VSAEKKAKDAAAHRRNEKNGDGVWKNAQNWL